MPSETSFDNVERLHPRRVMASDARDLTVSTAEEEPESALLPAPRLDRNRGSSGISEASSFFSSPATPPGLRHAKTMPTSELRRRALGLGGSFRRASGPSALPGSREEHLAVLREAQNRTNGSIQPRFLERLASIQRLTLNLISAFVPKTIVPTGVPTEDGADPAAAAEQVPQLRASCRLYTLCFLPVHLVLISTRSADANQPAEPKQHGCAIGPQLPSLVALSLTATVLVALFASSCRWDKSFAWHEGALLSGSASVLLLAPLAQPWRSASLVRRMCGGGALMSAAGTAPSTDAELMIALLGTLVVVLGASPARGDRSWLLMVTAPATYAFFSLWLGSPEGDRAVGYTIALTVVGALLWGGQSTKQRLLRLSVQATEESRVLRARERSLARDFSAITFHEVRLPRSLSECSFTLKGQLSTLAPLISVEKPAQWSRELHAHRERHALQRSAWRKDPRGRCVDLH